MAIAVQNASTYLDGMQAVPDLKRMSVPEKLRMMEALWDDLCRAEEDIPVPDWHKAVLDERERQVADGRATFVDWEEAKERIANRIA